MLLSRAIICWEEWFLALAVAISLELLFSVAAFAPHPLHFFGSQIAPLRVYPGADDLYVSLKLVVVGCAVSLCVQCRGAPSRTIV